MTEAVDRDELRTMVRGMLDDVSGSEVVRAAAESESRYDEHLWRPNSYMYPEVLRQRLEILKHGCYNVLSLGEGLRRLQAGELPWLRFLRGRFSSHKELWISCHCLSNNLLRRLSEAGF